MSTILEGYIADLVDGIEFTDNIPDVMSLDIDAIGKITKSAASEYVNDISLISLVMDVAYRVSGDDKGKPKTAFTESEKSEICAKVLKDIQSLPNKYEFVFPLPPGTTDISYEFTKSIKIKSLKQNDLDLMNDAKPSGNTLASLMTNLSLGRETYKIGENVLQITGVGWVSTGGQTLHVHSVPDDDPLFIYKVIMASYMARGVLSSRYKITQPWHGIAIRPYSYHVHTSSMKYVATIVESTDDESLTVTNGFTPRDLKSTNEQIKALFVKVPNKQKKKHLIDAQNRLKIAHYWYYEARKTTYKHVKIVHLTTAMDALLPEEKKEVKARIISSIVTNDIVLADDMYGYVMALYEKRNKIVHGQVSISTTFKPNDEIATVAYRGEAILAILLRKKLDELSDSLARFSKNHNPPTKGPQASAR